MPLRAARISIHVHVLDGLSADWLMIPQRFIYRTLLFLLFVAVVVGALHQVILAAFQHNPWLNGVILAILLFGIFFNIRRILRLKPEARWIDAFRTNAPGFSLQNAPRLLAPIAAAAPPCRPFPCATCWTASAPGSTRTATSRAICATC